MEVRKETVDLEMFIKGLIQSIQSTAKDKGITLSSHIHESLGLVLIDQKKMEKIVLNLLFNALKFTPGGGRVELAVVKEGPLLLLRIKDTGMGISEGDLPYIFDRFWQADSSSQRKYQGTGIGLAPRQGVDRGLGRDSRGSKPTGVRNHHDRPSCLTKKPGRIPDHREREDTLR